MKRIRICKVEANKKECLTALMRIYSNFSFLTCENGVLSEHLVCNKENFCFPLLNSFSLLWVQKYLIAKEVVPFYGVVVCPNSKFSVHKHLKLGTTKLHRNTRKVTRYHLQHTMSVVKCSCKFHLHYFQHQCHQRDIHCPHWIGIKKNDSTPILQGILSKPIQPKLLRFVFLKLCAMLQTTKTCGQAHQHC